MALSPTLLTERERRCFVYRFFDADGRLLYVGSTFHLRDRLSSHRRNSPWFELAARMEAEEYANEQSARLVEVVSIQCEAPLFNVKSTPVEQQRALRGKPWSEIRERR